MAVTIYDPLTGIAAQFADTVHEPERPTHSPLLGPNGRPLPAAPPRPIGFNLTNRKA